MLRALQLLRRRSERLLPQPDHLPDSTCGTNSDIVETFHQPACQIPSLLNLVLSACPASDLDLLPQPAFFRRLKF